MREKEKQKGKKSERKKKDLKLTKYLYMLLQTHLIYFSQLYKDYNYVWFRKF